MMQLTKGLPKKRIEEILRFIDVFSVVRSTQGVSLAWQGNVDYALRTADLISDLMISMNSLRENHPMSTLGSPK